MTKSILTAILISLVSVVSVAQERSLNDCDRAGVRNRQLYVNTYDFPEQEFALTTLTEQLAATANINVWSENRVMRSAQNRSVRPLAPGRVILYSHSRDERGMACAYAIREAIQDTVNAYYKRHVAISVLPLQSALQGTPGVVQLELTTKYNLTNEKNTELFPK